MPPKPWLTKTGPPREDVSAIIQSNPTLKQQIPKLSNQSPIPGPMTAQQTMNSTNIGAVNGTTMSGIPGAMGGLGATSAYGSSYGSGYGSSLGGMGGYGSSYGSSYGGGGYGSSYGMGGYGSSSYGMGGYGGGYGRMGMMGGMGGGDPNKPNMVMNTLMTLQSLGFLIGSFCQIGRSLDHNIQGLHLFFNSFKNLFKKIYDSIKGLSCWMGEKTRNTLLGILEFIKTYVLFMNHKDQKNKIQSLKIVINICVVLLVITLYPQVKKLLNKVPVTAT